MKTKMRTPHTINSNSRSPLRRGSPRKQQLPRTQAMWIIRGFLLIPLALALAVFAPSHISQAAHGGLTNVNTAAGSDAPANNLYYANTATGFDALFSNTDGFDNTATGASALQSNTTGSFNTANGAVALVNNTTGFNNTATGFEALFSNTTGG